MAALVAYQMAPAMLSPRPTTFHLAYLKSPNDTAPMSVMRMFLRLPATLVVSGSLYRVHTKVEWLIVSPSTQLRPSVTCTTCCHSQGLTEHRTGALLILGLLESKHQDMFIFEQQEPARKKTTRRRMMRVSGSTSCQEHESRTSPP